MILQKQAAWRARSVRVRRFQAGQCRHVATLAEPPQTQLEKVIRRKQASLQVLLDDLGMDGLEEKLTDAVQNPAQIPYKLGSIFSRCMPCVRSSPPPASSVSLFGARAGNLLQHGACSGRWCSLQRYRA